MSYRSIHKTDERFRIAVMFVLVAAFLIAMPMMFVHPGMTIMLFWVGLILVAAAIGIHKLFTGAEHRSARRALAAHVCPSCGAPIDQEPGASEAWHCTACGAAFQSSGVEEVSSP